MTLVFIHGLIGAFADPRALALLEPATVLAPDLHGYGAAAAEGGQEITIERQIDWVRELIDEEAPDERVQLIGHSVGGVIAAGYAHRFPERVGSFVNVEGNFTLADAFWSSQLAAKQTGEVYELLERDRADPERWLRDREIEPTDDNLRAAAEALAFQPAGTVHAMARTVVDYTGRPGYGAILREVFGSVPVHLVAGARSRSGWDVPHWALEAGASYTEIPEAGHMLMLEAPRRWRSSSVGCLLSSHRPAAPCEGARSDVQVRIARAGRVERAPRPPAATRRTPRSRPMPEPSFERARIIVRRRTGRASTRRR